jgi:autophagy-related protein 13
MGTLSLRATYLTQPHFRLDDLESLLSSRFLSLDEGPEFTPTLIKNQQRDSLSTSPPGSLPLRTALPRSPPSAIADRFVLPPTNNARTNFPSTGGTGALSISPGKGGLTQSPSLRPRTLSGLDSGAASGVSETSSSRRSISSAREDPQLASRLRRESLGSSPGSPSPLSARRPNIFKSSTLSNATSPSLPSQPSSFVTILRFPARLFRLGPLPQLQIGPQRSPSIQAVPLPSARTISSPVSAIAKHSPPFLPSSLSKTEERRSLDNGVGGGIPNPPTSGKRYSSSFGYRYAANTGTGSDGSPSSGPERKEIERPSVSNGISCPSHARTFIYHLQSASYMSNNTDDDDISAFVQDIDARKPLGRALSDRRRYPLGANPERADDLRSQLPGGTRDGNSTARINGEPSGAGINGAREPMLTNALGRGSKIERDERCVHGQVSGLIWCRAVPPNRRRPRGGPDSRDRSASRERALTARGTIPPEIYDPLSVVGAVRMRARRSSMGSVRSGLSIGSEEVIGKLELEDKRKSKGV